MVVMDARVDGDVKFTDGDGDDHDDDEEHTLEFNVHSASISLSVVHVPGFLSGIFRRRITQSLPRASSSSSSFTAHSRSATLPPPPPPPTPHHGRLDHLYHSADTLVPMPTLASPVQIGKTSSSADCKSCCSEHPSAAHHGDDHDSDSDTRVDTLPQDLLVHIMSFLPMNDLLAVGLVGMRWHLASERDLLWRKFCQGRGMRVTDNVCPLAHDYNDMDDDDDDGNVTAHSGVSTGYLGIKPYKRYYMENQIRVGVLSHCEDTMVKLSGKLTNNPEQIFESFNSGRQHYNVWTRVYDQDYYIYLSKKEEGRLEGEDLIMVCFSLVDTRSFSQAMRYVKTIHAIQSDMFILLVGLDADLRIALEEDGHPPMELYVPADTAVKYVQRKGLFGYCECSLNDGGIGLEDLVFLIVDAKNQAISPLFRNASKTSLGLKLF